MRDWLEVQDPFNVFQNTPGYTLKPLGCSRAGDFVEFEVFCRKRDEGAGAGMGEGEGEVVVAVSCCPWDVVSLVPLSLLLISCFPPSFLLSGFAGVFFVFGWGGECKGDKSHGCIT